MDTARLVNTPGGQVAILPEGCRLPGREALVLRVGRGVLLLPATPEGLRASWQAWIETIPEPDVPFERNQPQEQERDWNP
ncbi:MAG TPA: AbrB/MazE/SpoVT family DNA-binding domain-containing protein [Deinococcales bacterium]|nr:AbrB/MazE/SpoVT family DNA-binding domain-containing protein [Deinococcales bacterium]